MEVKGRDLVAGVPKTVLVNCDEIREALSEPINAIVEAVMSALERTPPELCADIVDKGIVLTGGGAQLKNLDVLLREETGLPVMVSRRPGQRGRARLRQDPRPPRPAARSHHQLTRAHRPPGPCARRPRSPDRPARGGRMEHGSPGGSTVRLRARPADGVHRPSLFLAPARRR